MGVDFQTVIVVFTSLSVAVAIVFLALRRFLSGERTIRYWTGCSITLPLALAGTAFLPVAQSPIPFVVTNTLFGVTVGYFLAGTMAMSGVDADARRAAPIAGGILAVATIASFLMDAPSLRFHSFTAVVGGLTAAGGIAMLIYGSTVGRAYRITFGVLALLSTAGSAMRSALAVRAGGAAYYFGSPIDGLLLGFIGVTILALYFTVIIIQLSMIGQRLRDTGRLLDEDTRLELVAQISSGLIGRAREEVMHASAAIGSIPADGSIGELMAISERNVETINARMEQYDALTQEIRDEQWRRTDVRALTESIAQVSGTVGATTQVRSIGEGEQDTAVRTKPGLLAQILRVVIDRVPRLSDGEGPLEILISGLPNVITLRWTGRTWPEESVASMQADVTLPRITNAKDWFALQFARRNAARMLGASITLEEHVASTDLVISIPRQPPDPDW